MKTLKLIYTLTIVLLSAEIAVYSQTDSGTAFKVDDISIDYSEGLMKILSAETGKAIMIPNSQKIENIYSVNILNDSVISVSNEKRQNVLLNINKIEQITVDNGTSVGYVFGGIGLGALLGIGIGAVIYEASKEEEEPAPPGYSAWSGLQGLEGIPYFTVGVISGAVLGGIIGAIIPSYKSYGLSKFDKDKNNQLEKILKKAKVTDSTNF